VHRYSINDAERDSLALARRPGVRQRCSASGVNASETASANPGTPSEKETNG